MKVVRGYLLRKKPSLTLKVLSLKACMLVRELTIHIYINIHSVAVSPRYTHTVIILKDQDRCRKKSEWNGGEEQGASPSPVTGWVSGFGGCYSYKYGILHTLGEGVFNVPVEGNGKETQTSHTGCQEPSHYSSLGGQEHHYKAEGKDMENVGNSIFSQRQFGQPCGLFQDLSSS